MDVSTMPTATQDTAKDTANAVNAVNEAVRATAEASRRTVRSSQEAVRLSRDMFEASNEAGRKLFLASTAAVTAGMKAAFDLQNMALAARLQMVDGANASYKELAKQVSDTTRQAQEATLEAWQAGISASEKLVMNKDKA